MVELAKEMQILSTSSLKEIQEKLLILDPMRDLTAVLQKFLQAQKVLASEEILTRLAYETCEDAFNDGIRLLELRFAPTFILDGHPTLTPSKILHALQKGLEMATKRLPLCAGLICIFQRTKPSAENQKILHFVLDHQQDFIAVDLADDETNHPSEGFKDLFDQIRQKNIPITIHSGEVPHPMSTTNIRHAVEYLGATRIGHGVQCIHDPALMNFLIKNQITLEICPHSNYLTQAFPTYEEHPLRKLYDAGIRVTINSDDPGIFNTQLSDDYTICHHYQGFGLEEFQTTNATAFAASFISAEKKRPFQNDFQSTLKT